MLFSRISVKKHKLHAILCAEVKAMTPEIFQEERKLVTVVFADLVGSTELAVNQDPEQLRGLLSAFFEEMAQQIRSFGGTVEKYAGDAIMAVFGVPRVHEDDAERAVRAAIAMQETIDQLNPTFEQEFNSRLELRVGIASGEVVAATQETREFMVTGEVANLASRLQSTTSGIVISEETHRLLDPLLESKRLEHLSLKGFSEPVTAYSVIGLRQLDRKPRGIPGLHSPMVGRDREAEILNRCVEDLQRARGQIISIIGEAGLGKSRLKIELREGLPEGVRWLEGRCYAHTQTTSYSPIIQILKTAFQLGVKAPPVVARTKLRAALRSLAEERYHQVHPVVAHLLDIELEPGQPHASSLDPRALQSQLVVAMRNLMEALSAQKPLILAFEDIHWADAASIELLTVLMELTDFLPLMILVVCRPDVEGGSWEFRFHAQRNYPHRLTEIQLTALNREQAELMIRNLLNTTELPEGLQSMTLERSDGNPLFLEEIIRTLIEEKVLRRERGYWIVPKEMGRLKIPSILRGVIAARIDRLPTTAKLVLQNASVVGRVFTYRTIQALTDGDGDLDRSLAHLLRVGFIREQARLPEVEYLFKHVLTQEAAYASILDDQRRVLHRKVAMFLEQERLDVSDEHAAVMAYHWLRTEDWEKALEYTLQAAERARKLYAQPEALAHYWQALELLDQLPRTVERRRIHIDVILSLSQLTVWFRDAAEQKEALRHIEEAMRSATDSGDDACISLLESTKATISLDENLFIKAIEHAKESGDKLALAYTLVRYANSYLGAIGQYEKALTHIGQAVELWGSEGATYNQAYTMASGGRCYCARAGKLEEALNYAAKAREIGETMGDARLRAWSAMEAEPYLYKGLWKQVVQVAEEGLPTAWEIGEWPVIFWSSGWLGIAYLKLGRLEDARRILDRPLKESEARTVPPYYITYLQIAVAQLQLAFGEPAKALGAARKALQLAEQSFRLEQGAANRVLGQVHETIGNRDEAGAAFRLSVQILGEIQSRPELAQTLLAYGRFEAEDDPDEGRTLIERALSLFEEMGATGWIKEARAALA
jgi:class 3 adenylate cyclase/tetratricopeptide (TPR) repeat protein